MVMNPSTAVANISNKVIVAVFCKTARLFLGGSPDLPDNKAKRDKDDSSRSLAPLIAAEDAVKIDCSTISIDEVVLLMLDRMS